MKKKKKFFWFFVVDSWGGEQEWRERNTKESRAYTLSLARILDRTVLIVANTFHKWNVVQVLVLGNFVFIPVISKSELVYLYCCLRLHMLDWVGKSDSGDYSVDEDVDGMGVKGEWRKGGGVAMTVKRNKNWKIIIRSLKNTTGSKLLWSHYNYIRCRVSNL